jgi:D-alanyl-D-alanine carboxypeptidase (penicillin-binding protein 5/6)
MKKIITTTLLAACLWSSQAAENYIIIDNQTGTILDSKNKAAKVQIASLTKIATALVALDWADLTKSDLAALAEVPAGAVSGGMVSAIGLQQGDSVSLRDLIYCALLASDNVAAHTLANHIGARVANPEGLNPANNFVAHMNALARTLFMKRTLFLNPSGMDHRTDITAPHSTAEDLARLVRHAYNSAGFAFYVSQKSREIHIFRGGIDTPIQIHNTNELLGKDGIDGVKTGRTRRAGDCLILSSLRAPESQREGETVFITPRRINVVLLDSPNRFSEGQALVAHGWALYEAWAAAGRPIKKSTSL